MLGDGVDGTNSLEDKAKFIAESANKVDPEGGSEKNNPENNKDQAPSQANSSKQALARQEQSNTASSTNNT